MRARAKVSDSIRACDRQIDRLRTEAKDAEFGAIETDILQAHVTMWLTDTNRGTV